MPEFNTLFFARNATQRLVVLTTRDAIWEFDGANWTAITGAAVDDGQERRWTGGWLTGALTLANQQAVRTYKPGVDTDTQLMVYNGGTEGPGDETWESKNYSAKVFRPFREYMLAGNLDWNGSLYPSRVQWSHAVEPGQVPVDWVPRDTNDAGDVDLADTPGAIIDMHPLRDSMLIYKRDSVYACNWVGGNQIFDFRRLTTQKGIHALDCVVEHNGYHWCQGIEDVFTVDGNTVQSLLWGRMKRTWLADRDEDKAHYNFTALDPVNEEVLFFYCSKNAPQGYTYPDMVLVLCLRTNALFMRDYELEIPHAAVGLDVVDQMSADLVFYGIDITGERLLDLEAAPDRLGAPVNSQIQRRGLFSDPGHDFIQVDRVKVQLSGASGSLRLGGQLALDAPISWRDPFAIDPATDYKTDARVNNQLIAYDLTVSSTINWQVSNLNLLVQKSGERG